MTKNHFIKIISLSIWMRVIAILLIVLYTFLGAISYWIRGVITLETCFYLGAVAGAAGVLYRKGWGRKLLIITNGIGLVYVLVYIFFVLKGIDVLEVAFASLFASVIFFYRQPFVKAQFWGPRVSRDWNILLIDDDKVLLKIMTRNFLQKGISLLTAETGERGLTIAERKNLDLIILDVILPKMKGREVCQRLKENGRTKDVPIIFLTVQNSPDDIQAEFEAGAVSHLTKPVDFDNLYQEIVKILGE